MSTNPLICLLFSDFKKENVLPKGLPNLNLPRFNFEGDLRLLPEDFLSGTSDLNRFLAMEEIIHFTTKINVDKVVPPAIEISYEQQACNKHRPCMIDLLLNLLKN